LANYQLDNLFLKIAFLNATSSPKQIGPAELFSPAESEIWPADQTGKLRQVGPKEIG
jgi:hypothetical protein